MFLSEFSIKRPVVTVVITLMTKPTDMETLVAFYAKVRPFGVWGPVRREAVRRRLVLAKDPVPTMDVVNSVVASFFQLCLCVIPMYMFLKNWSGMSLWIVLCACTLTVLYFTWYKYLPSPDER